MRFNIILAAALKKIGVNKLVYNNSLISKTLISSIRCNTINDINDARQYLNNISPKPMSTSYAENKIIETDCDLKIIIPAYNVEKYIEECLESIITQETEYKFEALVINDGSIDSTREIIKKYEEYPCIRVINQNNKGFSGARNIGLEELNSKYIMFVDSDDKLEKNAIQNLLEEAFKNNSDIVEGGFYKFDNNKILTKMLHEDKRNIDAFNNMIGFPWGKVIKASLFKNVKFPEGFWYEDTIFMYLIYPLCNKASTISDIVYAYRYNVNGISVTSRKSKKSIDTYWITEQLLDDMKLIRVNKSEKIYNFTLYQIYYNFVRTKNMNNEIQKSIFLLSVNLIESRFKNYKTNSSKWSILEEALRNKNYEEYYLFCILESVNPYNIESNNF